MKPEIVVMNFTHVYEQERFLSNSHFRWIDCTDLNGTDCYCDAEAADALSRRMKPYSPHGLHLSILAIIITSASFGPIK
jgi:hypothetical protein